MVVRFLAPAQAEAVDCYNSQKSELGSRFAEEVRRTIERILQFPGAWTPLSRRTRRCRTNKFPYGAIYQARGDVLLIVAAMHLHREPQTWKSRLIDSSE